MSLRRNLPKLELKQDDNLQFRYPANENIVSLRDSAYSKYFDDTKTIIYLNDELVYYPSTALYSANNINAFTSSIVALGNVEKNSIEGSFKSLIQSSKSQFVEHENHDLSPFDVVSDVNYNSSISHTYSTKLAVDIKLAVSKTALRQDKASVYYYNKTTRQLNEIAPELLCDPSPAYAPGDGIGYPAMDTKMFGPFGNFTLSGSDYVSCFGLAGGSNSLYSYAIPDSLAIDVHVSASTLLNAVYKPTSSHYIELEEYITQPFLLENAAISIPISIGPDWFADRTKIAPNGCDMIPDAGGPCITVALLRTSNGIVRDLVASGTIIPIGDNIMSEGTFTFGMASYKHLLGFKNFGSPSVAVSPNAGASFTGSVKLNLVPGIRNEVMSYTIYPTADKTNSYIFALNPKGRAGNNQPSGKSYLCKDMIYDPAPSSNISLNEKNFGAGNVSTHWPLVFRTGNSSYSPYILNKHDKLILVISKHRAIMGVDGSYVTTLIPEVNHDIQIQTGQIRLKLFGSQLRNDLEENSTQFNSNATTNSIHEVLTVPIYDQFDTPARSELIGNYSSRYFTGSLSLGAAHQRRLLRDAADVINVKDHLESTEADPIVRLSDASKFVYDHVAYKNFVDMSSDVEQYYDSIPPSFDKILKIDNAKPLLHVSVPATAFLFGKPYATIYFDMNAYQDKLSGIVNNSWTKSFPFEPKYSSAKRTVINKFLVTDSIQDDAASTISPIKKFYIDIDEAFSVQYGLTSASLDFASTTRQVRVDILWDTSLPLWSIGSVKFQGFKTEEFYKSFFGIGDFNNCHTATNKASGYSELFGSPNNPNMLPSNSGEGLGYGTILRGWKYGLMSGLPAYSKLVFRRDKYGQFRDMLEQRTYTKYYMNTPSVSHTHHGIGSSATQYVAEAVVNVKFVNRENEAVQPDHTLSSNLSFEATSSLPYIDGKATNRNDQLDTSQLRYVEVHESNKTISAKDLAKTNSKAKIKSPIGVITAATDIASISNAVLTKNNLAGVNAISAEQSSGKSVGLPLTTANTRRKP